MMRLVIALGGNALLKKGQRQEAQIQKQNIILTAKSIAQIASHHSLLITHGNGPQVGLLALQAESYPDVKPYPLDVLDAETEGMLGYQIAQQLKNVMPDREVVALITQVVVDKDDEAFQQPTKPIGPIYKLSDKNSLVERGWQLVAVGDGIRRVVPSPAPKRILELSAIQLLLDTAMIVVCAGGGGIPVVESEDHQIEGVAAVIDKDLTSAMLATELEADRLIILTDVDAVYQNWGEPNAAPLKQATASELRQYRFEVGNMGPKIDAACRFVEHSGGIAQIGALEDLAEILAVRKGTQIMAG